MNIKEQKGITLMVLMMTVTIMLILAGTIAITISSYGDVRKLDDLYSDLQVLREAVDIYYEKNGELPITNIVVDNFSEVLGDTKNGNDGPRYYKMNLQLLGNINLMYGSEKFETDYFAINEQSHTIYYCGGVKVGNKTYYGIKEIDSLSSQQNFGIDSFELKTRVNAVNVNGTIDIQLEVYTEIESDNISKYKFKINNEEWTVAQDAKTYTFHNLKKLETYKVSMMAIDNNNNEIYATNNDTKVTIKNIPANMTIDGKTKGTYNNPLIPAGFTAINENNAIWGSSDGYKNGLVITDDIDENGKSIGNEFVWVPVDGTIVTFERKTWYMEDNTTALGLTAEECSETLPEELSTGISNNGGFYIARYEAGKETINEVDTLASKQGKNVWNNINYTTANTQAANMYANSEIYGVKSRLISGAQWDTALKFITAYNVNEEGYSTYSTNSTGLGNYTGTTGKDTISDTPAATGTLNSFRQKNIYDLAGNLWEWTIETKDTNYITRGGSYGTTGLERPSAYRQESASDTQSAEIGFRVAIYLI